MPKLSVLRRLPVDTFLALLVATVMLAAVIPARGIGAEIAEVSVTAAVALLFFLYGARLSPQAVKGGLAQWRVQSLVLLATYGLFPLLGLALGHVPGLQRDLVVGLVYLTLLPSTVQSSIAFTSIARGNVPAALCSASVSNVLGVFATPLLVSVMLPAAGSGFSLVTLAKVAAEILLPFVAGQIARPWIGDWLGRHRVLTSVVDRGSILLVVYAAFSAGMVAGVWTQLSLRSLALVAALDAATLALVLAATTLTSRWLKLTTEDEIAIVFCGSKKSMAGGIPMATILFPGHAVGLIVLPLMIFHQVQLFVCAVLARRYAARGVTGVVPAPTSGRTNCVAPDYGKAGAVAS
jgi:sodium/bile acid cotransporter 7